ncbi:cell division protein FtsK [Kibdelosporangium aridum]|uniref:Cell division protein FtsK n=1 Tax=Kibdelosporangium aridum TaxID=2030 RepID=A0A428Z365_KIBAR|nr:FtsK/SpoIIIE domain-containing protein [Kibdelosporangium aridum]RSM80414.1 cell division protein FtsK [Kibdelosporangium aridum]
MGEGKRKRGQEWRAMGWMARHPGMWGVPGAIGVSTAELGTATTGGILGGLTAGVLAWYRGDPDSFDRFAAPRIRAFSRRWTAYRGRKWRNALLACDLAPIHRRSGEPQVPQIVRVRAYGPSVDIVHVKIVPGQHVRQWEARLPELTEALKAERLSVERVKPLVIALLVQRMEPFTEVIPAPDMPWDAEAVDLSSLYFGETEYGEDWREPIQGQHWLVSGATGAGKNSIGWSALRGLAPMIRDGSCRVYMLDPKRMELSAGKDLAYRYASESDDCVSITEEFVEDMRETQRKLAAEGLRKTTPSRETPLNLLMIDELAALMAFGDNARFYRKALTEVGTQGRATGHGMFGFVQEPTKDTVPIRDLFTRRVSLRTTSASYVDMVLGDGARLRGALADEIPATAETAGIGYRVREKSRVPIRVRAAYVNDAEIKELVDFVTGESAGGLRVVA